MKYNCFMSLFDQCVHNVTDNNQIKLTRLFQFTTGCAKRILTVHVWSLVRRMVSRRIGLVMIIWWLAV